MDTNKILTELRAERDRINNAISAIEELNSDDATHSQKHKPAANVVRMKPRPRHMSAAGRKRIAEAARAMWAKRRKMKTPRGKKTTPKPTAVKKAPAKRGMSAAARKRMSEMMKKRWAEGKMKKANAASA